MMQIKGVPECMWTDSVDGDSSAALLGTEQFLTARLKLE